MAQAFANMHSGGKVKAYSAGSKPSGMINPKAISSMKELGYDLSKHDSKSIDAYRETRFDAVITMGCGDDCPFIPTTFRADWQIPDPRNMDEEAFRIVRDEIESKVKELLSSL